MSAKVTLTVTEGDLPQSQYEFVERTLCVVGRREGCEPRVPDDGDHRAISRHHCLLDINPPEARVRDLGSMFGTFVNGEKIGQREREEDRGKDIYAGHRLKDGDELRLGDPREGTPVTFRIGIVVPALCEECSAEIPEGEKDGARIAPGLYKCRACQSTAQIQGQEAVPAGRARVCARCGRDVFVEVAGNQAGAYLCPLCRARPAQVTQGLLQRAGARTEDMPTIAGYRILKPLGRGGMGAVYLARDENANRDVAFKIMLPQVAVRPQPRERFLREVLITQALRHPHVVELYDSGCIRGVFFFTLEHCQLGSVDKLMKQRPGGVLPDQEAVPIILDVLDGLEYAHTATVPARIEHGEIMQKSGVVHRDVKPQNIFLSSSGGGCIAKVGDYGLAKAFDAAGLSGAVTISGSVGGTPAFTPYEQAINFKRAKPDVDVWAAAASLYFMLTGFHTRDFPLGENPWRVILESSPVAIRKRTPSIPRELARVIDAALVDTPEIKIKTAAELKHELQAAIPRLARPQEGHE